MSLVTLILVPPFLPFNHDNKYCDNLSRWSFGPTKFLLVLTICQTSLCSKQRSLSAFSAFELVVESCCSVGSCRWILSSNLLMVPFLPCLALVHFDEKKFLFFFTFLEFCFRFRENFHPGLLSLYILMRNRFRNGPCNIVLVWINCALKLWAL